MTTRKDVEQAFRTKNIPKEFSVLWKEKFLPFEEARAFVKRLKFKCSKDWRCYYKSGNKPAYIPSNPWLVYRKKWISFYDWFGIKGPVPFRSFKRARFFVRNLKFTGSKDWKNYCKSGKKPLDIPSAAQYVYKEKGWVSWGDWFGTGRGKKVNFLPFKKALKIVHSFNFKNYMDFRKSKKIPSNIPRCPESAYKNKGWTNNGDWLGTGTIATINRKYLSFESARRIIRSFKFKNQKAFWAFKKSKNIYLNIPKQPGAYYKNKGWVNWSDWLGTTYLPFKEARSYVRKLRFKKSGAWLVYCSSGKKPFNIPSCPNKFYEKDWVDMSDWLGVPAMKTFNEAKAYVKSLRFKRSIDWIKWCASGKKPLNIPSCPYRTYKKEWQGWHDWLGYELKRCTKALSYKKSHLFIQEFNLKNSVDWKSYCKSGKRPANIPSNPDKAYKNKGWISWGDWFGKKN